MILGVGSGEKATVVRGWKQRKGDMILGFSEEIKVGLVGIGDVWQCSFGGDVK